MLIGYARGERKAKKFIADHESGKYTMSELAEDYGVSRATVYRTIKRDQEQKEESR